MCTGEFDAALASHPGGRGVMSHLARMQTLPLPLATSEREVSLPVGSENAGC